MKVCTSNKSCSVTEKQNNLFKQSPNMDGCKETLAGGSESARSADVSINQQDIDAFKGTLITHSSSNIPLTLTFFSFVFGGEQDKHFLLSAMNGFCLVLILNNTNTAFQIDKGI